MTNMPLAKRFRSKDKAKVEPGGISLDPENLDTTLLGIAVPAFFALASDPVASLVDTALVGKLGADPLAATGLATAILNLASKIFTTPLVAVTTTQVASSTNDKEKLSEASNSALQVALTAGIIQTLLLLVFAPIFAQGIVGSEGEQRLWDPVADVLRVRALACPAIAVALATQGMFRGIGDTRTPLVLSIAANVLNLIFDLIFLFELHLGAPGAALATSTAELLTSIVLVALAVPKLQLRPSLRLDALGDAAKQMAGDTIILSFRSAIVWITFTVAAAVTARIDADSSAAYQICQQLWLSTALVNDALAIAAQTVIAQAISSGNNPAAKDTFQKLTIWAVVIGFALGAGFLISSDTISSLFSTDEYVQEEVKNMLPFVAASMPIASVAFTWDGVLYAVKDFTFATKTMFLASGLALTSIAVGSITVPESDDIYFIW
eukprot:CAMPEP_0167743132 /NCGR_PEP_ID=MMETSP0110_2-20121227/1842_1 /TAXON_ID=629695 /ORGANISM="Gymnochlora sp., Strain CCMP2014" /LENGTH=436 /DNA_ID=CAMNT_0007627461 /DNA_START=93 /DNA_END=1400 /DNA_ORIENTATION=+